MTEHPGNGVTSLTTHTTHTRISDTNILYTLNHMESNHRDGPTGHAIKTHLGHKIIFKVNSSGHVKGIVRNKNIQCQHLCTSMYQDLSVCISRDFSSLHVIEMYG